MKIASAPRSSLSRLVLTLLLLLPLVTRADNPEGEDSTGRPGGTCRSSVGCLLEPENTLAVVGLGVVLAARLRCQEGR